MIAYHGEQALKDACISRMREHRELDLLLRGTYAERTNPGDLGVFQGCAVGCLVGEALIKEFAHLGPKPSSFFSNTHSFWAWNSWANQLVGEKFGSAYRRYLGIPTAVARWEEAIFESDLCEDPHSWPERFLEAIPVGADLTFVAHQWSMARTSGQSAGELMDLLVGLLGAAPVPGLPIDQVVADESLATLAGLRPLVIA